MRLPKSYYKIIFVQQIFKSMKRTILFLFIVCFGFPFLLSSCATIVGGSKYNAHVFVNNHPDAIIKQDGMQRGIGQAFILINRREASQLRFTVEKSGCKTQAFNFNSKVLRGWTIAGTILGWTGVIGTVPVPWGVIVDGSTGAWWKPNVAEPYVSKQNYKNFNYHLPFECDVQKEEQEPELTLLEKITKLRELYDTGMITEKEYEREKQKLLDF